MEIVITEPGPGHCQHQPHDGGPGLAWPPATILQSASNHQQSPPSTTLRNVPATLAGPSFFILPRNGMEFSTLLHAIQKNSEKDTRRPVKNYIDCIAVFRIPSPCSVYEMIAQKQTDVLKIHISLICIKTNPR